MKLPQIPRKAKGSPRSGSGFQPPAFVSDVFKDMRDRRLIAPAVALLVAIVAVPVLLSSTPDAAVPPAPLAPDPDAAAVEPGVLAVQEIGVRDYRERLDSLKRKNPFGDRFESSAAGGSAEGSELLEPVDSGEPVVSSSVPDSGEPVAQPSSSPPAGGAPAPVGSGGEEEPFLLAPRIDVEVGIVDRDRRQTIDGVKSGDLLPSKKAPVAMFLGNNDAGSEAGLLVSRDVSRVNGDGECKPGRDNCEFLRLEDGDSAYLRFADGKRYVISVKDIYFERVPESKAEQAD
jgi:hypothetical protein